jgi:hypothetical protein
MFETAGTAKDNGMMVLADQSCALQFPSVPMDKSVGCIEHTQLPEEGNHLCHKHPIIVPLSVQPLHHFGVRPVIWKGSLNGTPRSSVWRRFTLHRMHWNRKLACLRVLPLFLMGDEDKWELYNVGFSEFHA